MFLLKIVPLFPKFHEDPNIIKKVRPSFKNPNSIF